jgi:hypothetical protein
MAYKIQDLKSIKNMKANDFYTNKIHSNQESYEKEKKRVTEFQRNRYENDEEYRERRKGYCRIKMKEYYQRKKANAASASFLFFYFN